MHNTNGCLRPDITDVRAKRYTVHYWTIAPINNGHVAIQKIVDARHFGYLYRPRVGRTLERTVTRWWKRGVRKCMRCYDNSCCITWFAIRQQCHLELELCHGCHAPYLVNSAEWFCTETPVPVKACVIPVPTFIRV